VACDPAPARGTRCCPLARRPRSVSRAGPRLASQLGYEHSRGYYLPEASYLGQPKAAEGLEAMRAVDAGFFEAFPDHYRDIEEMVVDDDSVVVLLSVRGPNLGSRGDVLPTGQSVHFQICNMIQLRDSRILSMRQIYDSAQITSQLA
jgi:predicted ester cyclase